MSEEERLRKELERAYRAVAGLYCHFPGRDKDPALFAYHSLTIGAALRYVHENSLEGSDYFEGKNVEVLHKALMLAGPSSG